MSVHVFRQSLLDSPRLSSEHDAGRIWLRGAAETIVTVFISLQKVIVSPAKPCVSRYSLYYLFDVHADFKDIPTFFYLTIRGAGY